MARKKRTADDTPVDPAGKENTAPAPGTPSKKSPCWWDEMFLGAEMMQKKRIESPCRAVRVPPPTLLLAAEGAARWKLEVTILPAPPFDKLVGPGPIVLPSRRPLMRCPMPILYILVTRNPHRRVSRARSSDTPTKSDVAMESNTRASTRTCTKQILEARRECLVIEGQMHQMGIKANLGQPPSRRSPGFWSNMLATKQWRRRWERIPRSVFGHKKDTGQKRFHPKRIGKGIQASVSKPSAKMNNRDSISSVRPQSHINLLLWAIASAWQSESGGVETRGKAQGIVAARQRKLRVRQRSDGEIKASSGTHKRRAAAVNGAVNGWSWRVAVSPPLTAGEDRNPSAPLAGGEANRSMFKA
ncbi:hypothetical protein FB45DRAFT_1090738 [Roridomyces roridus]|uniref:Uncharacterized protein n=1 Tax=Roridomyces roridus TaxID=1738132 RepID=A0AAD7BI76_9AGAR|nr:hypothetical protein FB45DRAFT_1090738 [Roridomyces roridus]